jgi:hypothetical protein
MDRWGQNTMDGGLNTIGKWFNKPCEGSKYSIAVLLNSQFMIRRVLAFYG